MVQSLQVLPENLLGDTRAQDVLHSHELILRNLDARDRNARIRYLSNLAANTSVIYREGNRYYWLLGPGYIDADIINPLLTGKSDIRNTMLSKGVYPIPEEDLDRLREKTLRFDLDSVRTQMGWRGRYLDIPFSKHKLHLLNLSARSIAKALVSGDRDISGVLERIREYSKIEPKIMIDKEVLKSLARDRPIATRIHTYTTANERTDWRYVGALTIKVCTHLMEPNIRFAVR